MKTELTCVVRIEDGRPIIFFRDGTEKGGDVSCFTKADGHNSACRAYMRSLPLADHAIAEKAIAEYQAYLSTIPGGEDTRLTLGRRLGF